MFLLSHQQVLQSATLYGHRLASRDSRRPTIPVGRVSLLADAPGEKRRCKKILGIFEPQLDGRTVGTRG